MAQLEAAIRSAASFLAGHGPDRSDEEPPEAAPASAAGRASLQDLVRSAQDLPGRVRQWIALHRASTVRLLDALDEALVVFTVDGVLAVQNRALREVLSRDPEGERVLEAARQRAAETLGEPGAQGLRVRPAREGDVRELRTSYGRYCLRGFRIGEGLFGHRSAALVTAHCTPKPALSVDALRSRFGLTSREAAVALMLADGMPNGAIARELGISANTARHHTARVLLKLGAKSRAEVGTAVRRGSLPPK